jgi:hypothetical protein
MWSAIQYNIDDDYWVNPLGIYSTKEKAIAKIMKEIDDSIGSDNEIENNNGKMVDAYEYRKKLKKKLLEKGECDYIFGYLITQFYVDDKHPKQPKKINTSYLVYDMTSPYKSLNGEYQSLHALEDACALMTSKKLKATDSNPRIRHLQRKRHIFVNIKDGSICIGGGKITEIGKVELV